MVSRYRASIIAYRIADIRYPIFDGSGARMMGGRWNSPGQAVIYASLSYACAMVEKMAQVGTSKAPRHQAWIAIQVEDFEIEDLSPDDLPEWDVDDQIASRRYGDDWIQSQRTPILFVPSVIAPADKNVIINPAHPDFLRLICSDSKPVNWDKRLFREE
jgi:RES domain-containing protein